MGGQVDHLYTADFSNFFTSLPHIDFMQNLDFPTDQCFSNDSRQLLAAGYKSGLPTIQITQTNFIKKMKLNV